MWLFPWSVYFPAVAKLSFKPVDRAGRTRLLALCWVGFVLVFFTFSTTQEYYSMPFYPALALLLGSAMATGGVWVRRGTRVLSVIAAMAAIAVLRADFPGAACAHAGRHFARALAASRRLYTVSRAYGRSDPGSFAYLRVPLAVAGIAFLIGALGTVRPTRRAQPSAISLMMVLFFHAARLAMVSFDPFLSSRPLAEAILQVAARQTDHGRPVLHFFVDILLHESGRASS